MKNRKLFALFALFCILFVIYANYVRFTNVELTETQLFLKIFGLL